MNTKPHILFLTTSSLATNPRLVKEFECLKTVYYCIVICFEHQDWSLEPSKDIMNHNQDVKFIVINRHQQLFNTLLSKVYHKVSIAINALSKTNVSVTSFASNDKTKQLLLIAKSVAKKQKIDRVVAHNLGAFYPALIMAKSKNVKLQIDVEDYHPGEALYFNKKHELNNRHVIMQEVFKKSDVVTFASEGIKQKCERAFDFSEQTKTNVVINAFKKDDFLKPKATNDAINMVWFSQNISENRGLEEAFDVAKQNKSINFHLIGKANKDFIEAMQPTNNIKVYEPMTQEVLHQFLSKMDIGLALERKDVDGNRDICLTNKFLAYAQAGLYILASDTFGQKHFLQEIGSHFGELIKTSLKDTIKNLDTSRLAMTMKQKRWLDAKSFSWELECKKLLDLTK